MGEQQKATRDGYGQALVELGETNPKVVVLTADLKESTRVEEFAKRFPDRFIECGVAEQNMAGIAAGLAAAGKIPFISSYAVFSPGRNWDQIRVSVCYSNLPVKIIGAHAGLSVGPDGATHQALEDIAITRVLPNLKVIVPCDFEEARKATIAAASLTGPVYIRLTREKTPLLTTAESAFSIGKAEIIWNSSNPNLQFTIYNLQSNSKFSNLKNQVAIIGCGPIVYEALEAARQLHEEGIGSVVVNNHTVKPMDEETIVKVAKECGAVVTVEEHQTAGGMGSAVAEVLAQICPVPIEFVGVKDSFGESGMPGELAQKYGLKAKDIVEAVRRVLSEERNPKGESGSGRRG
jgi:transketolase